MSRIPILVVLLALMFMGCGKPAEKKQAEAAPVDLVLVGPVGEIRIDTPTDSAKKAFPAPKGALTFSTTLSFSAIGSDGWAWQTEDGSEAFEILSKDGKVAAVAITRTLATAQSLVQEVEGKWGKPTHRYDGKSGYAESWLNGTYAGMIIQTSIFPGEKLVFVLLGSKSDLAKLNYDADDPRSIVTRMDQALEKAHALEPTFKEASRKAMEKAQKK